jgi:hypothetical protein
VAQWLVLGDSILWGQGLDESQKGTRLAAGVSPFPVDICRYAHGGADIRDDDQSGLAAAINPEPPAARYADAIIQAARSLGFFGGSPV